jgi:hypothetical protein
VFSASLAYQTMGKIKKPSNSERFPNLCPFLKGDLTFAAIYELGIM